MSRKFSTMNTMLFTPISIGPVELPNRIAVPPMAMYSARSGVVQLFTRCTMVTLPLPAPASSASNRPLCRRTAALPTTTWASGPMSVNKGLKELVDLMHEIEPECRVMVQLNHAGRKASSVRPWRGPARTLPPMEGGWRVRAPSPIPFSDTYTTPREIEFEDCRQIAEGFWSCRCSCCACRCGCGGNPYGSWLPHSSIFVAALEPSN